MEASRGQNGIQLLLATEQEAQQIANTARNNSSGDSGANVKWLEHETDEKSHYPKTEAA